MNIVVLGCGVIGVSTAINIQKLLPEAKVEIIADKFDKDTTSIGAGAIFLPDVESIPGVSEDKLRNWVKTSWEHFSSTVSSGMCKINGINMVSGYLLGTRPIQRPMYADIVYTYRDLTQEEVSNLSTGHYRYGSMVATVIIDMTKYLPWLMLHSVVQTPFHGRGACDLVSFADWGFNAPGRVTKVRQVEGFQSNGGRTTQRKIRRIDELYGQYDVVVNCTGLGSRYLFNDQKIYPVRGQLIRVEAPWIKEFIFTDDHAYILPNSDRIVLGGTKQANNHCLEISPTDRLGILERCQAVMPSLQGAKIIDEWVGLRPARTPVRLETEVIKVPKGHIKVIHNYGHGSNGVALSWGTAVEAANLVKNMVHISAKL